MELKPTPPHDAKQRYLKKKQAHVSDKTYHNYNTALKRLLEFLDEREITDMRDVDSDEIVRFESWRLDSVKPITCRNDMRTVSNFIQFCESIQAVPVSLHELVIPTKVSEDEEICEVLRQAQIQFEERTSQRRDEYERIFEGAGAPVERRLVFTPDEWIERRHTPNYRRTTYLQTESELRWNGQQRR